jgi:hypothetical protein
MGRRKHTLTAAEKAAKQERREEFQTIFLNGRMKRVRRPPTVDGMSIDEFIQRNADPIFLHQEGMWDVLEANAARYCYRLEEPTTDTLGSELVDFDDDSSESSR